MKPITRFTVASAFFLSVTAANTHAALYDRGNGMIYDSTQNITWLQDANYAKTSGYAAANIVASHQYYVAYDGSMSWASANEWADNLVYQGVSGWRLPSAKLSSATTPCGLRLSQDTCSEMGHLVAELGNTSDGYSLNLTNRGPFLNIAYSNYWENDLYSPDTNWAWNYGINANGSQEIVRTYGAGSAWAVHDGDIANVSSVPVPAAAWLFGSGLLGLVGTARRKAA